MTIHIGAAAAAYAKNARAGSLPSMEPRVTDPAQSFGDMVTGAIEKAIDTGRVSEQMSAKGIAGTADLREVVSAVTNAEVTLQTALAIRDRVIQAYHEIVSMPI